MMRNSINSYLTSLVMVLALLLSANAFATETVRTTITIDGKEYYLYTGFNAIEGTGYNEVHNYEVLVDGDMESWYLDEGGYVEFSSILPIALKGYVFDSMDPEANPSSWTLKAKANEEDDWNVVSSRSDDISSGTNFSFACDNQENKAYRYFRFEMEGEYVALSEIRLYGGKEFYFFLPQKSATCTETGIKQACYFGGDGKYFADETGTNELSKDDVVEPRKPHDLIHHEEDGVHSEYWQCSVCGKFFSDGEGSLETGFDDTFINRYIDRDESIRWFVSTNDSYIAHTGDIFTFELDDKYLDVRVSDGINDLPITSKGNGVYSFTVPAANVTISAELKPEYKDRTLFEIGDDYNASVSQVMISSGVSTVKLKAGTSYYINDSRGRRFGIRTENPDYSFDIPYASVEGEFTTSVATHHCSSIPKEDGWYDISLNEVGDGKWNLSIVETEPQIEMIFDQVYTGNAITPKPAVTLGTFDIAEGSDYEYSYTNNVNVGTATVTVTFLGEYDWVKPVSKSFNITKATPTVERPTSANPKYAGNCVELVNPGITDFGVILYSIKEDEGYSSDIPCADAAGNYTVYYKVEERDNWSSVEGSVDVSVVNEEFTVTFVDAEGETISSDKYPYGTSADRVKLPPENPEKADDEMYAYTFAGWSSEIQDVTGAKTYSPNYDITRIGFGPITIAKDSSSAIIDGMSRDPIDKAIKDCMIKGEVTLYRHFAAGKYSTLVLPFSTFTGAFSGVSFYSFRGVEKENGVWKTVVFGYVDKENEGNKLIEANTPYIVVADADMDDLVVKDGVLFNADDPKSSYGATLTCSEETCDEVPDENKSWQFVGTYNYRQWDSGNNVEEIGTTYGFAGAAGNGGMEIGKFGKIKEGAYIYPMRAYLRYQPPSPPSVLFKAAPAYASVASIDELPESLDVVIRDEEGTTVIGTINTRTGEFRSADNRWFDLNGRYLGNKKPTVKGTYYNNGKKVIVK